MVSIGEYFVFKDTTWRCKSYYRFRVTSHLIEVILPTCTCFSPRDVIMAESARAMAGEAKNSPIMTVRRRRKKTFSTPDFSNTSLLNDGVSQVGSLNREKRESRQLDIE